MLFYLKFFSFINYLIIKNFDCFLLCQDRDRLGEPARPQRHLRMHGPEQGRLVGRARGAGCARSVFLPFFLFVDYSLYFLNFFSNRGFGKIDLFAVKKEENEEGVNF